MLFEIVERMKYKQIAFDIIQKHMSPFNRELANWIFTNYTKELSEIFESSLRDQFFAFIVENKILNKSKYDISDVEVLTLQLSKYTNVVKFGVIGSMI